MITLISSNELNIPLKKDHSLHDLIALLYRNNNTFKDWGNITVTHENSMNLWNIFEPWLLHPISLNESNDDNNNGNTGTINCNNARYSNVLTGSLLKTPMILIDFIPFGYDVDKLLIRFYESYNIIDIYIIYEGPYTLAGNSCANNQIIHYYDTGNNSYTDI